MAERDDKGRFIDLCKMYDGKTVSKAELAGFVMPDLHIGDHDPVVYATWEEMWREMRPKKIFTNDPFNGHSVNQHEKKKVVKQAQSYQQGRLELEKELREYAEFMNKMADKTDEIIIIKSNHDEFLSRYLDDGKYPFDEQNFEIAHECALAMFRGEDPLEYAAKKYGIKDNFTFLQRDESYKISGIELGYHGDHGLNGARGSLVSMEMSFGNSVSGHTHTTEILRGAWSVGTTTYMKLGYNKGPSSWMHSCCLVYNNGMRQMITSINGKWRLK